MNKVTEINGAWVVTDDAERVVKDGFSTNAEAWRWLDLQAEEPISPSIKGADYGWRKYIMGS